MTGRELNSATVRQWFFHSRNKFGHTSLGALPSSHPSRQNKAEQSVLRVISAPFRKTSWQLRTPFQKNDFLCGEVWKSNSILPSYYSEKRDYWRPTEKAIIGELPRPFSKKGVIKISQILDIFVFTNSLPCNKFAF